jgi:hypothetical protein
MPFQLPSCFISDLRELRFLSELGKSHLFLDLSKLRLMLELRTPQPFLAFLSKPFMHFCNVLIAGSTLVSNCDV